MTDDDTIIIDENLLDKSTQNSLPVLEAELGADISQLLREAGDVVDELQVVLRRGRTSFDLSDRMLELGAFRVEPAHPRAQLIEVDKFFLVGIEQLRDRTIDLRELSLEVLGTRRALFTGIPQLVDAALDLSADQIGIFKQPRQLRPDHRIDLIGSQRGIVASRSIGVTPSVGAEATVVVEHLLRRPCRRRVEGVAAASTNEQPAQQHRGAVSCESLVPLQLLLRALKHGGIHDGRHGDLDPFIARPRSRAGLGRLRVELAGSRLTSGLDPLDELRLAKRSTPRVRRIAQHAPDHGSIPRGLASSRSNAALGQFTRDATNAPLFVDEPAEESSHDFGLEWFDFVARVARVRSGYVAEAVGRAAQNIENTAQRLVALASSSAFENLRTLVLRDHPLELDHKLIFRRLTRWRTAETHVSARLPKLLEQQHLMSVLASESIGRIDQDALDHAFGDKVTQSLQRRTYQSTARVAVIEELPFVGNRETELRRPLEQLRSLAFDRLLLALLVAGHACIDRRFHRQPPRSCWYPLLRDHGLGRGRVWRTLIEDVALGACRTGTRVRHVSSRRAGLQVQTEDGLNLRADASSVTSGGASQRAKQGRIQHDRERRLRARRWCDLRKPPRVGDVSLRLTGGHRVPLLKRGDALSIRAAFFDELSCASKALPSISRAGSSPGHLVT